MKTATLTIALDVLDDAPLHIDPHTSRVRLGHLIARRLDASGHDLDITEIEHDAPATTLTVPGMIQAEATRSWGRQSPPLSGTRPGSTATASMRSCWRRAGSPPRSRSRSGAQRRPAASPIISHSAGCRSSHRPPTPPTNRRSSGALWG